MGFIEAFQAPLRVFPRKYPVQQQGNLSSSQLSSGMSPAQMHEAGAVHKATPRSTVWGVENRDQGKCSSKLRHESRV